MYRLSKKQKEMLDMLKEDLKGEIDTIKLYEKHIEAIDIPDVKKMLIHIMEEEQEHVDELNELIDKYQ